MQIFHKKLNEKLQYPLYRPYKREEILFFDIETTGFLASASYLYLIGVVYYKEDSWYLTQWFADDMHSEQQVLDAFFTMLISFKKVIHYNGSSFDIPYLDKKYKQYKLDSPLTSVESFDIYQKLNRYKKLLPVTNLKLKTIETFAGLKRVDKLSGEELIQIYANFIGKYQFEKLQAANNDFNTKIPKFQKDVKTLEESIKNHSSSELKSLLLLHNEEDVVGLLKISNILYFTEIFENTLSQNLIHVEYKYSNENTITALLLKQEIPLSFGKPVRIQSKINDQNNPIDENNDVDSSTIILHLHQKELRIEIPIYYGELKFFPDNYSDYYYLPLEDMVVHKSVAQFVDKEFRQKVKAQNCYIKKISSFLPMPSSIITPLYRLDFKDKLTFSEFKDSDLTNNATLSAYFGSLLDFIKCNGTVI